jgi:hypothetical protein
MQGRGIAAAVVDEPVAGADQPAVNRDRGESRDSAHRVTGGSRPPPVPTERSVRISRTKCGRPHLVRYVASAFMWRLAPLVASSATNRPLNAT